jgi:hypothetical protein
MASSAPFTELVCIPAAGGITDLGVLDSCIRKLSRYRGSAGIDGLPILLL